MGKLIFTLIFVKKMGKATKSGRILKYGRVVLLLSGRYAGRKGVIVKVHEESNADRKFPHALVAGIDRYPRKVHKKLSKKRFEKKTKIKPFIKYVNLNHMMPTRHILSSEIELESFSKKVEEVAKRGEKNVLAKPDQRSSFRKELKKLFESKYRSLDLNSQDEKSLKMKFFYKKLRF